MDTVLMIVVMGAALYFLMIRPQQKKAKEQKNLMAAIAVGSRIMTVSGIIGTIKHLGEKQAVIEISPGVEMTIDKRAISPQAVEDEFEYADDSLVASQLADEPEFAQPALTDDVTALDQVVPADEPLVVEADEVEPSPVPVDSDQPVTWDNPDTQKN